MKHLTNFRILLEDNGGKVWDLLTSFGYRIYANKDRNNWDENSDNYFQCYYEASFGRVARAGHNSNSVKQLKLYTIEEFIDAHFEINEEVYE